MSAYPGSALCPSGKSQTKYWLCLKHDFLLHNWEQVNPPLWWQTHQQHRASEPNPPQHRQDTHNQPHEVRSYGLRWERQTERQAARQETEPKRCCVSLGATKPRQSRALPWAAGAMGRGVDVPPRPAWVYLTPFLLREAGELYMGVSQFTDVQPCCEKGTFLFLEMRS